MEADRPAGDRIGPWTRLSSREIYRNPWIRVREDQVLRPDGSPGIYGVVEFQNLAVGVVPVDAQGRVTLVGQYRYPTDNYAWEIPEGGCLKGRDTLEAAAARELREETGLAAARWDYLGCMATSNSTTDEVGHIYLARELTPGPAQPEPTELLMVKQVDLQEALRMALEGGITESISVIGLARAWHFLSREKAGHPPVPFPRVLG